MKKNKILIVVGPTSVGKTALGIRLAQKFDGEIISGDSQQVYRTLDIGTAKATQEEQAAAPHHLIDVRNLEESFSVHDFVKEATKSIEEILGREKLPIIVGGTGLYIQALTEGYHLGGQNHHQEMMALREQLSGLSEKELYALLDEKGIDIPEKNQRRAIRALEIAGFGGGENAESPYEFHIIGLNTEREILYSRIDERVDKMMDSGLLDEAKALFDDFPNVQATKGIGYKEFFPYFSGQMSLEESIELVKRNSRRYAKRQLTWFRNRMNVKFFDVFDEKYPQNALEECRDFLTE